MAPMTGAQLKHQRNVRLYFRQRLHEIGCEVCGWNENPLALELDHIVPCKGRRTKLNSYTVIDRLLKDPNTQVLCGNCHNVKSNLERMGWWNDGL